MEVASCRSSLDILDLVALSAFSASHLASWTMTSIVK